MTVAQSFVSDTWTLLVVVLVWLFVFGERRGAALLVAVWLVCAATLYWRSSCGG